MWDHLLEILALLLQFPVLGWYLLLSSNAEECSAMQLRHNKRVKYIIYFSMTAPQTSCCKFGFCLNILFCGPF